MRRWSTIAAAARASGLAALLAFGVLSACYDPDLAPCRLRCGMREACPATMSCSNGRCTVAGQTCDSEVAEPEPCLEGAQRCDSFTKRAVCDSATRTWLEQACAAEAPVCDGGECYACASGAFRCDGDAARTACVGGAWADLATACPLLRPHCQAGQCEPSVKIDAGGAHACAVLDGKLKCWGKDANGQLGDGQAARVERGRAVTSVSLGEGRVVRSVVAGGAHTCALLDGGAVKCWGDNALGQLGLGDRRSRGVASGQLGDALTEIDLGGEAVALAAGQSHTCALLKEGRVKCWGANHAGQLGLGDIEARGDEAGEMGENLAPVDFGSGRGAVALAAGAHYNCAALTDGRVSCWGANDNGQLGLDPSEDYGDARDERGGDMPSVAFDHGFVVSTLALGTHHACALSSDGRVVCWGVNGAGQLGVASPDSTMTPVVLDFGYGKAAFAIAAGANHTCAILDGGELHCWGYNDAGQLGVGTPMTLGRRWLPAAESPPIFGASLEGAIPIVDVSAGSSFTCALLETEAVKCWGDNTFGQLGAPGETGEDVTPFTLRD